MGSKKLVLLLQLKIQVILLKGCEDDDDPFDGQESDDGGLIFVFTC